MSFVLIDAFSPKSNLLLPQWQRGQQPITDW